MLHRYDTMIYWALRVRGLRALKASKRAGILIYLIILLNLGASNLAHSDANYNEGGNRGDNIYDGIDFSADYIDGEHDKHEDGEYRVAVPETATGSLRVLRCAVGLEKCGRCDD